MCVNHGFGMKRFPDERTLRAALELERLLGAQQVITDPDLLESYAGDESHLEAVRPAAVIRARSARDIATTLERAAVHGVPVTPRAAGTGKSGGAIPVAGGLVLATAQLDQILEIDGENLIAVVQPGVITARLHEEVESRGLFYPPDPASLETCCIGGNVAENAGGPRAFKYGVTNHYVLGLSATLMGGESLRVGRRTVKGVAGYDLTQLLVGSEGTLGIFTEITLRLVPKPQGVRTLMALFDDPLAAGGAVSQMVRRRLVPRVIELLDGVSVETLRSARKIPIPRRAGAMLLIEVDGDESRLDDEVQRVADACDDAGAIEILATQTQAEARQLWAGRRELSELLGHRGANKLSDDVVVPRSEIASLLRCCEAIAERTKVLVATYGHAGDGNIHVNVIWDDGDPREAERALEDIVRAAVELGGTITGEHGVGAAKRHLLHLEQSQPLMQLQRALKKTFDPQGLLNPGKIFPDE
jgi:glycolate oxidase